MSGSRDAAHVPTRIGNDASTGFLHDFCRQPEKYASR
jgi:hypothetical protein